MNVTDAIDQITKFTDNLPTIDTNNALRRQRILYALIETCRRARERDFWWTLANDTVYNGVSSTSVFAPDNCQSLTAPGCGIFLQSTGSELEYLDPIEMKAVQQQPNYTTDTPETYSVYGMSDVDSDGNSHALIQLPRSASGYALDVHFKTELPTLDEDTGVDNLAIAVPDRWHQTVLIPGTRALLKRQRGANGWKDDQLDFERGLSQMRREEKQGRSGLRQIPPMFGFGR